MKLRLTGTHDECDVVAGALPERLAGVAEVLDVSEFYPNRGTTVLGRVYLEVRLASASGGRRS
jgi:hypothetical protein